MPSFFIYNINATISLFIFLFLLSYIQVCPHSASEAVSTHLVAHLDHIGGTLELSVQFDCCSTTQCSLVFSGSKGGKCCRCRDNRYPMSESECRPLLRNEYLAKCNSKGEDIRFYADLTIFAVLRERWQLFGWKCGKPLSVFDQQIPGLFIEARMNQLEVFFLFTVAKSFKR